MTNFLKGSQMNKFILITLLFTFLSFKPALSQNNSKKLGVYVGKVINNQDPKRQYRVKVKFPWTRDRRKAVWTKVSRSSNSNRGSFSLPEVGDEVIVAFLNGDMRKPVVIGSLYNGVDRPPER